MSLSPAWSKSSYSNAEGGNCIEARHAGPAVQVRDSKDPDSPVLTFGAMAWQSFTAAVKDSRPVT